MTLWKKKKIARLAWSLSTLGFMQACSSQESSGLYLDAGKDTGLDANQIQDAALLNDSSLRNDTSADADAGRMAWLLEGFDERVETSFAPTSNSVRIPLHPVASPFSANSAFVARLVRGRNALNAQTAQTSAEWLENDWFLFVSLPSDFDLSRERASLVSAFVEGDSLHINAEVQTADSACAMPEAFRQTAAFAAVDGTLLQSEVQRVVIHTTSRTISCARIEERASARSELQTMHTWMRDNNAWLFDHPVQAELASETREILWREEELHRATALAARRDLLDFPIGHAGSYPGVGQPSIQVQNFNPSGLCLLPYESDVVVEKRGAAPAIDLRVGDVIHAVNYETGERRIQSAAQQMQSWVSIATADNRRMQGARAALHEQSGSLLHVRRASSAPNSMWEKLRVGPSSQGLYCGADVLLDGSRDVTATLLPSGIAHIQVRTWYPTDSIQNESYDALRVRFQARVLRAFNSIKNSARAIVWDIRGNQGGLSLVGLAVVAGMNTARATHISQCQTRTPGTEQFGEFYLSYDIEPGGEFAFSGPSVVLANAEALSASDYFLLATRAATSTPILGTGASGGYGAASPVRDFPLANRTFTLAADANRCVDANGQALETHVVEPDLRVEQNPSDLANGVDTQLQAALDRLQPLLPN